VTQLETPLAVAVHALTLAKKHGVATILNPAPATELPDSIYAQVDYFTPNEAEAAALAGVPVATPEQAEAAAGVFLNKGVGTVVITLGENGVLVKSAQVCEHIAAFEVERVIDTTGAGDAFNGGFATALAQGRELLDAVRFGCATAAISVSRPGCAPSMPQRHEIDALLAQQAV
jgi:ribokinase